MQAIYFCDKFRFACVQRPILLVCARCMWRHSNAVHVLLGIVCVPHLIVSHSFELAFVVRSMFTSLITALICLCTVQIYSRIRKKSEKNVFVSCTFVWQWSSNRTHAQATITANRAHLLFRFLLSHRLNLLEDGTETLQFAPNKCNLASTDSP